MKARTGVLFLFVIGSLTIGGAIARLVVAAPASDEAHRQGLAAAQALEQRSASESQPLSVPVDAQFTLYCGTIAGADHIARASSLKRQLLQTTDMRDWLIVHGQGQSTIYYGFYANEKDPRASADRAKLASLCATTGQRLFSRVWMIPLPSADPEAPAEWNLENAKGAFTLQIAVYYDSPERKKYAVDAVREARAAGHEAYYYHGPGASLVCIGAWPETAIREPQEVRADNPQEVVGVSTGDIALPARLVTVDGRPVRVVQPKAEILDPTLLAAIRQFPHHAVNGVVTRRMRNPQTGKVREVTEPSRIVRIPRRQETLPPGPDLTVSPVGEPAAQEQPSPPAQKPAAKSSPQQQGGRLRSIED